VKKKKEKAILNTKEVAEYFQIHALTVQRYAREGKIPAFKIGPDWKFHKKQLDKWIKERLKYKSANNAEQRLF
jgi:excisionase family DNA binding protein